MRRIPKPEADSPYPVAVLTSDWHLRVTPPSARLETDWFAVMEERLDYLLSFHLPIVVAGDVFDRWNPPSELVTFAIRKLNQDARCPVYSIAGQHDLPEHRLEDRFKGAYGALCEAGVMVDLGINCHTMCDGFTLYSMPWGKYELPIDKRVKELSDVPVIAVVHKYAWHTEETKYPDAPDSDNITSMSSWFEHFDGILVGDNHISFKVGKVFNHGSLFTMSIAQSDYKPRVGLLMSDGTISLQPCTEKRQLVERSSIAAVAQKDYMAEVMQTLAGLHVDNIVVQDLVRNLMETMKNDPGKYNILSEIYTKVYQSS